MPKTSHTWTWALLAVGVAAAAVVACGPLVVEDPVPLPVRDGGAATLPPDAGTPDAGAAFGQDDGGVDAGGGEAADAGMDAGPPARLRIAVVSDLNGGYGSTTYEATVHQAVQALVQGVRPDVVLVSGDMVAGQQAGLNYAAMWQGFHGAVTTPLGNANIPVMPAPGNHDASAYGGFEQERAEYARQWNDPARKPKVRFVDATGYPFHYSFEVADAFFVALDATTVGPIPATQRAWVEAQLSQAASYPVKVVFGHLPLHPATVGRETEVLNDAALEKVMKDKGVTLFVAGHHHGYYPGAANGLRQVVMPCLGAGPRALIGTGSTTQKALVVIEVEGGKVKSLEALSAPGFRNPIPRAGLPRELRYGAHVLQRDDLAGF